ncbi:unnamed protein product [Blepharisma stoltei]|uniref:Uncharacterized protein n=1 Tax=Blepharisma stoltei TaxID=1481888 RepID=A0AAU9JFC2_9CILI|nr:unnamed protein product [Blepharisma stoltei]
MAFYSKDTDKSTEKLKPSGFSTPDAYPVYSPSPYSQLQDSGYDSVRTLEIREMQEEEKYIQGLRQQREKIEAFSRDLDKKVKKIRELEEEIKNLKGSKGEIQRMAGQINKLTEELRNKEEENEELKQAMRKQVEEYEYSLNELQSVVMKERDDRSKEIRNLKNQNKAKDEEISFLAYENEKAKKQLKLAEEKCEAEIIAGKEKDKQANEQIKAWKAFERMLKDQVAELGHEKGLLESKINELREKVEIADTKLHQKEDIEPALIKEKKKNEELRALLAEKEKELESLRENKSQNQYQIEEEFNSLHNELSCAMDLIKRQENTIIELRMRKKEDDLAISSLTEDLTHKEEECERIQSRLNKYLKDSEEEASKTTEIQITIQRLKSENLDLKKQLQSFIEKEQQDKLERRQFAKMKIELLNQRDLEVGRLTEAIDAFAAHRNYSEQ